TIVAPLPEVRDQAEHAARSGEVGVCVGRMRAPLAALAQRIELWLPRVAPRIAPRVRASRCDLPLGFGRQCSTAPARVGVRIEVRDADDRKVLLPRRWLRTLPCLGRTGLGLATE